MIFELLTTLSFLTGLHFVLTIILPVGVTIYGTLFLLDRLRVIVHRAAIDGLEILGRWDALRYDCAKRELAIADAGLQLRARRLELRRGNEEIEG